MDGCWSWVVLVACLVSYGTTNGMLWSMGIYMVPMLDYFNSDQRETALALSIAYSLYCFTGPIGGIFYKLIGCRWVVISSGLIAATGYVLSYTATNLLQLTLIQTLVGIGYGLTGPSILAVQAEYFSKYRSLATSLVTVGCPVGLFMFPQMFTWLIDVYGWRGSMLINAGLALQLVVAGAMIRPTKDQNINTNNNVFDTSVFKNPKCWHVWAIVGGCRGLTSVYFTFINAFLIEKQIEKHIAAIIISLSGVTNFVGRLVGSALAHHAKINTKRAVLVVTLALMTLQPILTGLGQNIFVFGIGLCLLGLCDGLFTANIMAIMMEQFGCDSFATVQGINGVAAGTAIMFLPQIAGKLADEFGLEYAVYFSSCAGCISFLNGAALFAFGWFESKAQPAPNEEQEAIEIH